jgi:hypothetical protein
MYAGLRYNITVYECDLTLPVHQFFGQPERAPPVADHANV